MVIRVNLGEHGHLKEEVGTYKNIEKTKYGHPYVPTSSYSLEYPMTSPWNHGKVKRTIEGKALKLCWISSLIWFLRNFGCFIMS